MSAISENFIPVGIFILVGVIFPFLILFISSLIRPAKPEPQKYTTYECSIAPTGGAWVQHNVQYYMFAILFVVFDVETVFLYPWAVNVQYFKLPEVGLGLFAAVEVTIFVLILAFGLVYAWKKEALEWM